MNYIAIHKTRGTAYVLIDVKWKNGIAFPREWSLLGERLYLTGEKVDFDPESYIIMPKSTLAQRLLCNTNVNA